MRALDFILILLHICAVLGVAIISHYNFPHLNDKSFIRIRVSKFWRRVLFLSEPREEDTRSLLLVIKQSMAYILIIIVEVGLILDFNFGVNQIAMAASVIFPKVLEEINVIERYNYILGMGLIFLYLFEIFIRFESWIYTRFHPFG